MGKETTRDTAHPLSARHAAARKQHSTPQHDRSTAPSTPSTQRDALYLRAMCAIVLKITTHDIEERLRQEKVDIRIGALMMLHIIRRKPATIKELSDDLFVAPPTLIPLVDGLERKGLICRQSDPHDRRKTPIALTAKGESLVAKIPCMTDSNALAQATNKLGPAKTEATIKALEALVAAITGNPETPNAIRRHVNEACR